MVANAADSLQLPSREEADARLDALDSGARYRVKTAARQRDVLDEPVLAAAVVAVARRERHRLRLVAVGVGAAAVVGTVAAVIAGALTWLQALIVVAVASVGVAVRVAGSVIGIRKSERRHAAVLERAGEVPPAGPSLDLEASRLGRTSATRRLVVVAAIMLALVASVCWVSWQDRLIATRLQERGEVAQARVVDTQSHRKIGALLLSDRHVVTFQTDDGQDIEATVIKEEELAIRNGDTVEVRYDPLEPTVARLAGDTDGRSEHVWIGLAIGGLLSLVVAVSQWRLRRGQSQAGGEA